MFKPLFAIVIGSVAGGVLRWGLSVKLNTLFGNMPPGTLAANLIAAYIIGFAAGFFPFAPGIAPEWRVFIMSGFCGGLSTFSTFSVEVVALLQRGETVWAMTEICVHVAGSLMMTVAGIASAAWLRPG